jgi:hypothetical protein
MITRTLKILGWIVGGLAGLIVVLYLTAVAINWRDREPSSTAIRFEELYRDRPKVADADNGYVYLLGFGAAPEEDAGRIGGVRAAWLVEQSKSSSPDFAGDPLSSAYDVRGSRDHAIQEFVDTCRTHDAECSSAFLAGDAVYTRWIASESWLLERYETLIAHTGWLETAPFHPSAPLPSYARVMDGQKLLLLKARTLAAKRDYRATRTLLERDLRFWRRVLEASDILITKMIATAALDRHFELGNLILRDLGLDGEQAMPDEWRIAISPAELSLSRCIVGEWIFFKSVATDRLYWESEEDVSSFGKRVAMKLLVLPLYQRQDTINGYAGNYSRMAAALDVPLNQYEGALRQSANLATEITNEVLSLRAPYNIVGRLGLSLGVYDLGSYGTRVADIEGVRRAALAAVTLRAAKVEPGDVAGALIASPMRNPYNDRPFEWADSDRSIVFQGLASGDRGEHHVYY